MVMCYSVIRMSLMLVDSLVLRCHKDCARLGFAMDWGLHYGGGRIRLDRQALLIFVFVLIRSHFHQILVHAQIVLHCGRSLNLLIWLLHRQTHDMKPRVVHHLRLALVHASCDSFGSTTYASLILNELGLRVLCIHGWSVLSTQSPSTHFKLLLLRLVGPRATCEVDPRC